MGFVKGIGQHTHIKHKISVQRQAVLETEGLQHHRQTFLPAADEFFDMRQQLRSTPVAGVDDMGIGLIAYALQELALGHNCLQDAHITGIDMAAR